MLLFLLAFFIGISVGSFLNVLIDRLPRDEKISGRSYCDHCKKKLRWYDLMPVFSFLTLRGKCRYCHKKISLWYPLVELITGILFIFVFWNLDLGFDLTFGFWNLDLINPIYLWIIGSFLIVVFFSDLKYYIIPDKIIYPAIGIAFLYQVFRILNFGFILDFGFWNLDLKPLVFSFSAAIFAGGFFLVLFLLSRGKWLGFGDVKLGVFMGLLLSWPNILAALFFAYILGAIIGVGLILAGKKKLKSEIPFGPFLVGGTFITLFWGTKIISWYFNLFLP